MVHGQLIRALNRPVDAASLSLFRIAFGALLLLSTLRFIAHGWVRSFYLEPKHFFHYWGLGWLEPLPGPGMYALYGVLAIAAACVLLGVAYRAAAWILALGFSYAHLCDKTNYLNHYYLIGLLTALVALSPLDCEYSWRALRKPAARAGQIRAWVLYLFRFQVAVVYFFGGLGKLGSDWLIHGEPLRIWLSANTELPGLGRLLSEPGAALVFSWAGALFDLCIAPLLAWPVTRVPAYLVLLGFHGLTGLLLPIGIFPWVMIVSATVFWSPSWPRAWARRLGLGDSTPIAGAGAGAVAGADVSAVSGIALAAYALLQLLLPVRSGFYPGNTLWSEEGFRFAWKVMLIEKAGSLEFRVRDDSERRYLVSPREYLTPLQARMASTQPDMILELAQIIAQDFRAKGHRAVRVYADCEVSFNGRRRQRLIDPNHDLAGVSDGLQPKPWILPAPTSAPIF